MSHYNTTSETGQYLIDLEQKTVSQEEQVYGLFKEKAIPMAWFEIKNLLPDMNEVSLKRCLSNLKTAFKLEKTSEKVISIYGRPSYRYKLI